MDHSCRELGSLRKREIVGGLLYLPMFFFGSQLLAALIVKLMGMDLKSDSVNGPVNLVYHGLNTAILGAVFLRYLTDQLRRLQDRGWALFSDLVFGGLANYGLSQLSALAVGMLLTLFDLDYFNLNQAAADAALFRSPAFAIVTACVLAPISEELLFRGLIFCGLYRRSRVWAYVLSMLAFSLAHVFDAMFFQPLGLTFVNLIVYLPAGFVLARTYERSGSIWSAIFLHAALNALSMLLQGMEI